MNVIFSSKFVRILKTLSEEEWKSFELWLKSPWCNTNKNLVQLLEKLEKYYPLFDSEKLTKEKLFRKVLPNGKFSHRRMNNLLSEGYLAAERFLVFQNLSKDQNLQKDLLTKEQQSRYLDDWFFRDVNKEITQLEEKPVKDWEDHLHLLQLHRRIYHHPNQNPRMQPGGTTIVKMDEQIDFIYLLEKATIINEKIFRHRILKHENHGVDSDLKQWQLASEGIEHPAIEFYRKRFAYTPEKMLAQYLALREDFLERYMELNEKEKKVHLLSLLNDTVFLTKSTLLDITESLSLYQLGLETGIILHQGKLTLNTYITIIAASNTKKTFEFTSHFIDTYTRNLDEPYQADAKSWALAHQAYWMGHLMDTLDILLQHEFNWLYFQRITKILLTQVYFDLYLADDSYQFYLFNFFDAFEKWLLREKLHAKFNKKSYLRFVQVCRKLAKSYGDVNFHPAQVQGLLANETNIQASNWLNQKIDQIITFKGS
ncbi:MAG: hypothetical protein R2828_12125 [Saprospiraceae bacterium]